MAFDPAGGQRKIGKPQRADGQLVTMDDNYGGSWAASAKRQAELGQEGYNQAQSGNSVAQQQHRIGMAQAQRAGAQQAVGRGSSPLAQRAAMYNSGNLQNQANMQGALLRAQETAAARQQYMNSIGQQAQGQMGYSQMSLNRDIAQAQSDQNWQKMKLDEEERERQFGMQVGSMVMSVAGGAAGMSDENAKVVIGDNKNPFDDPDTKAFTQGGDGIRKQPRPSNNLFNDPQVKRFTRRDVGSNDPSGWQQMYEQDELPSTRGAQHDAEFRGDGSYRVGDRIVLNSPGMGDRIGVGDRTVVPIGNEKQASKAMSDAGYIMSPGTAPKVAIGDAGDDGLSEAVKGATDRAANSTDQMIAGHQEADRAKIKRVKWGGMGGMVPTSDSATAGDSGATGGGGGGMDMGGMMNMAGGMGAMSDQHSKHVIEGLKKRLSEAENRQVSDISAELDREDAKTRAAMSEPIGTVDAANIATMRGIEPKVWKYKDSAQKKLGLTPRTQAGPMAQNLEKTPLGKTLVYNTPVGKKVDTSAAALQLLGQNATLQKQIDEQNAELKRIGASLHEEDEHFQSAMRGRVKVPSDQRRKNVIGSY